MTTNLHLELDQNILKYKKELLKQMEFCLKTQTIFLLFEKQSIQV